MKLLLVFLLLVTPAFALTQAELEAKYQAQIQGYYTITAANQKNVDLIRALLADRDKAKWEAVILGYKKGGISKSEAGWTTIINGFFADLEPVVPPVEILEVSSQISGLSSNPAVWGGTALKAGLNVIVSPGTTVTFDVTTPALGDVSADGRLVIAETCAEFRAKTLMIHGYAGAGTVAVPRKNSLYIEMNGRGRNIMGMGDRFIGPMNGTLELVAETAAVSWTFLNENVNAGSNSIILAVAPGWRVGDEIIVTSSDYDYGQTEKRTIIAIDGKSIALDRPLTYYHHGSITHIPHGKPGVPEEIDERSEVALLTRTIKVGSPEDSHADKFGTHIMAMGNNAVAVLDGVELVNMGQSGILGRYPMHWHNVNENGGNSVMRNCSTHHSFQRGTTIHKTNHVWLKNNVIYDTLGHGVFLEDGGEEGNYIVGNLVAGVHRGILDTQFDAGKNHFKMPVDGVPACYWISNPNNHFIDNAAAGQTPGGIGFWFDLHKAPRPNSITSAALPNYNPSAQPFGVFRGNRAHSGTLPSHPDRVGNDETSWGLFAEAAGSPARIENFTAFKNQKGQVWTAGGHKLVGCALAGDLPLFNHSTMEDSLCVFRTSNPIHFEDDNETWWVRNFALGWTIWEGRKTEAVNGYDALPFVSNCVITGYHSLYSLRAGNVIAGSITDSIVPPVCLANLLHSAEVAAASPMCIRDPDNLWKNGKGFFTFNPSFVKTNSKILNSGGYWIPGEPPE